ncbi:uncharacterized protein CCOS01_09364 [Colletotrichum costaricense]|uniref:Impact N-terminal domain-containing protein n=2 Tax=Colletotrichum acutatum species complex TaxID=2707335 RepID=A0AAJ0DZ22_9PEZI|nr:uncharacterized protein CCOS01_09364 [Colletotrichum costaricense]KAK1524277.1 hypothetical protein CCOS01_09364 [Colletotrichum costaricense]
MASQHDLQELLRVITSRKGVTMMAAMGQVKALQTVELRSIQQISDAPLDLVERGLGDSKSAKALQTACKTHLKRANTKRSGDHLSSPSGKRPKSYHPSDNSGGPAQSVEEMEAALSLSVVTDEKEIAEASIYTNRAPLMLAFVLELLRHTMPMQPMSSRLSLAQAVVSANSKSKAISIGLTKAANEDSSWGEGQPKVNIMGRAIAVLKRGDFDLQGSGLVAPESPGRASGDGLQDRKPLDSSKQDLGSIAFTENQWSASRQVTFKSSTFVARVANVEDGTQASGLLRSLLLSEPQLQTATHNAWAYRVKRRGQGDKQDKGLGEVREACEDDGETGCGEFIQRLIREAGIVDVIVVLTRWFGGEMLGTDRWRLMRNVVTEALSQRLRFTQTQGACDDVALWALDLQNMDNGLGSRSASGTSGNVVGIPTYRPESARAYLLKSFASGQSEGVPTGDNPGGSASKAKQKRVSKSEVDSERMRNLGRLLGALRLLFDSWSSLGPREMDRKAYSCYATRRANQLKPTPTTSNTLETADAIFKARKIPLLASGVVALGLGIYISLLASSFYSSTCHENPEPAPDAVPTGRPHAFTKDSAKRFDQSLEGSEWLMGITSLRKRLAAEASGHVLEVAMGTGRNLPFYDWSQIISSRNSATQALAAPKANARPSKFEASPMISYTGIDISDEMLGVAVEKLAETVPELADVDPIIEKETVPSPAQWNDISYLAGRLRILRSDIHEHIPSPPQQPCPQAKYDFICSTFSLCSVRDPEQMVRDLASKVKPNTGKIVLVEHGRGWWGFVNGLLDKSAASHFQKYGCWWNRDIAEIVENAAQCTPGLQVTRVDRPYFTQLGTTLWIELKVSDSGVS